MTGYLLPSQALGVKRW